jgi:hypothetical protein
MPLLIRGSSDLLLFSISTMYIMSNILKLNKIQSENNVVSESIKV